MIPYLKNRFGKSDFFKDSFWALIGSIAIRGCSLVAAITLANILQKGAYGEFNSLKNTLTTLAIFSTFGLGYTSTKFVAESLSKLQASPKKLIRKIYVVSSVFSGFIAVLLFFFAREISTLYYNDASFYVEIRMLSPWLILLAVTTAQNGIISGLKVYKKLAIVNIAIGVLTLIVVPLFSYFYHIMGACVSLLVIQAANASFNYWLIKSCVANVEGDMEEDIPFKAILIYSLPLTLIEAVYSMGLWINYYLIQTHFNYGEVALYSTAMQWYLLLLFVPMILRNVILSHFSSYDKKGEKLIFKNAIILSFGSALIPMLVIFATAQYIEMLYGNNFEGLAGILRLASIIPLFAASMGVFEQFLFARSKNWLVLSISLLKDGGTCGLFFWFINQYHIKDAAYYLLVSYLILNIFAFIIYTSFFFILKSFGGQKIDRNNIKI